MGINLYLCFMKKLLNRIVNFPFHVENLILYFIIRYRTGCPKKSEELYNAIYDYKDTLNNDINNSNDIINVSSPIIDNNNSQNSKKQEIIDSINYLRNKSVKTKQDKESIYTLEMVLKNMK